MPLTTPSLAAAVAALGAGALTEDALVTHVHPLFARVLARKEIYLANHSLGRPPDRVADDVREMTDRWVGDLDGAWAAWLAEMTRFRAGVAALIGCARPDAVVPRASAGQGLRAVLNALAPAARSGDGVLRVVTTTGEFDSVEFILRVYEREGRARVTRVPPDATGSFRAADLAAALDRRGGPGDGGADLLVVSHVFYSTGQVLAGLGALVAEAHRHGARALVDLYHSAGVLPLGFDAWEADFALGGSYKYTRGGPGAAWLCLRGALLDEGTLRPIDTGWFGKRDPFSYRRDGAVAYGAGGEGWLESTPAVLPFYQARAGLEFTLAMGVERLRAYSVEQQAFLLSSDRHGVPTRVVEPRGAFVLVPHDDLAGLLARLKAAGVNADGRPAHDGRSYVRLCPDVLNTRRELTAAAAALARAWG